MKKYTLKNRAFLMSLLIFVVFLCSTLYFLSYFQFFEVAKSQRIGYSIVQNLFFLTGLTAVLTIYAIISLKKGAKNIISSMSIVTIGYVILSSTGAVLVHSNLLYSSHLKSVSAAYGILYTISGFGLFKTLLKAFKVDSQDNIGSLTLRGRLKKDILILSELKELCFIQSTENYCEIVYRQDAIVKKKVFRASVRELDKQLVTKQYMRVHKSYILNLELVDNIAGNANNSVAHLKLNNLKVPIARSKREAVLKRLELYID